MKKENKLIQKIKNATASNIVEYLTNIFKAGLGTSHPLGAIIASLMGDYIPSKKLKRIEQFATQIANDLQSLENRVNEDMIKTDEFAFVFEQCFKGAAENYQKEKLNAFRGILINSAIGIDLSDYEKEYFLNLINNLSVLHIRILKFLAKPTEYLNENNISQNQIQGGFKSIFKTAMPDVDTKLVESAFGELHQYGFLNTRKDIFYTMTSGQGLHLLGDRTTDLAKKFINFCTLP